MADYFEDSEPIITPTVKMERINEEFSAIYDTKGYGIVVKNNEGTESDPYQMIYLSNSHLIKAGKLFFDFANLDPNEPKDIYANINTVIFRFCPAEALPIQIYKLRSESSKEQAISLQKRMLEAVKSGLSGTLD